MKPLLCALIGETRLVLGCAEILLEQGHEVQALVSPLPEAREWCRTHGVRLASSAAELAALEPRPDLLFSVVNNAVLPASILELPRLFAVNYHYSLLPDYAGPHATSWAILNGETRHGISWHVMTEQVDAGDVLAQAEVPVANDDTAFTLDLKCSEAALAALRALAPRLADGSYERTPQDLSRRRYFSLHRKPTGAGLLRWSQPAEELARTCRALTFGDYPNTLASPRFEAADGWAIVERMRVLETASGEPPGTIVAADSAGLRITTGTTDVLIERFLGSGSEFVPGQRLPERDDPRLETLSSELSRHEAFWVERLASARPVTLPSLGELAPGEWITGEWLDGLELADVLAFLAASAEPGSCTVGYESPELRERVRGMEAFFAAQVPLDLEEDPKTLSRRGSYSLDVFRRHPRLRERSGSFAVTLAESSEPETYSPPPGSGGLIVLLDSVQPRVRLLLHTGSVRKSETPAVLLKLFESRLRDPAPERHAVELEWNDTDAVFPDTRTLTDVFEAQVDSAPDRTAVTFRGESLSYEELERRANRIAHFLIDQQVPADRPVAILLRRGEWLMPCIFGILKAGAAYVPLGPDFPARRLRHLLEETASPVLLTEAGLYQELAGMLGECPALRTVLLIDQERRPESSRALSFDAETSLWDHVGRTAFDLVSAGGWKSSYTGEWLGAGIMTEYAENVAAKLGPWLRPGARLLEIGCSSGLSLLRLAPEVGYYCGLDLSAEILQHTARAVREKGLGNVRLARLAAHEIDRLKDEEAPFDGILLNSVVQYFGDHGYLRDVLRKTLDLLGPRGFVFLGNVWDLDLREEFQQSLADFARENAGRGFVTKTDRSNELFLSRAFLDGLAAEIPALATVEHSPLRVDPESELARYSFDTLIQVDKSAAGAAVESAQRCLARESLAGLPATRPTRPARRADSRQAAYVLYTSGSTGNPKGVVVEHRSVINRLLWMQKRYPLDERDVILQKTPLTFDVSVWELFWWTFSGASVCLLEPGGEKDPAAVVDAISANGVTALHFVPSMLGVFLQHVRVAEHADRLGSIRHVFASGEALQAEDVHLFNALLHERSGARLHNLYGPTEATVDVSFFACSPLPSEVRAIPIGRPIDNTRLYVLDPLGQPSPAGVPGEIYIGGTGVARGYWRNPALTAERFVPDPFESGGRLYRTGDQGRWLPNGAIEYLGRNDHQVKVRGVRIETGEIESHLRRHPGVEQAVVVPREVGGDRCLAAYFTGRPLEGHPLRDHLRAFLPDSMVPDFFVHLDTLPLGASGKVERKALPDPAAAGQKAAREIVAPRDAMEEKLAALWREVLALDRIGVTESFFELGGHSLKGARMLARAGQELGVTIPFTRFFARPTIAGLAEALRLEKGTAIEEIRRAPEQPSHPLTPGQQTLWTLAQTPEGNAAYVMSLAWRIEGEVDAAALEEAFRGLIERHEVLRTRFVRENGEVRQVFAESAAFTLDRAEMDGEEALRRAADEAARPFDLHAAPLMRALWITFSPKQSLLVWTVHHLIADGQTLEIWARELERSYRRLPVDPVDWRYRDFVHHQIKAETAAHAAYWREKLSGDIPPLDLARDFPRPPARTFHGARQRFAVEPADWKALRELCAACGCSPFMGLLAAAGLLLSRHGASQDFIVGVPVAGRERPEWERAAGLFVNTLALRLSVPPQETFRAFLARTASTAAEAYSHQAYPFARLVADLGLRFDVMVAMEQADGRKLDLPGATVTLVDLEVRSSKFDLTFELIDSGDRLDLSLHYDTGLFLPDRVARLGAHFQTLLRSLRVRPEARLEELEILPLTEQASLAAFAGPQTMERPGEKTVIDLFREMARRYPHRLAVVSGKDGKDNRDSKDKEKFLTYRELDERACHVARALVQDHGLRLGERVGVSLPRTTDAVAAFLGVLAAGGVYVPLDLEQPLERRLAMSRDADCRLVIDDLETLVRGAGAPPVGPPIGAPAYLIFTSGSTGKPKGVEVGHAALACLVESLRERLYAPLPSPLREALSAPLGFDVSIQNMIAPLCLGHCVYVVPEAIRRDARAFADLLAAHRVELINVTPSFLSALLEVDLAPALASLRHVILGAEPLPAPLLRALFARAAGRGLTVSNLYGPTEACVDATGLFLDEAQAAEIGQSVPIGRPLPHVGAHVLDGSLRPAPIGVEGDLFLTGEGLALGYVGDAALTAERFLPRPDGARMYATGDRARWRTDGDLEIHGRSDGQVKIRGYRVEPGEIEAALLAHAAVREACVTVQKDGDGTARLAAWIAVRREAVASELQAHLRQTLPDAMIPSVFLEVERLPMSANGKVDRKALAAIPAREIERHAGRLAPRTEAERHLAEVWGGLLGRDGIGVDEDFFFLGGDSIKALQAASRLTERGWKMEMTDLFQRRTIAALAPLLRPLQQQETETAEPEDLAGAAPLTPIQRVFFDEFGPGREHFNLTVQLAGRPRLDAEALRRALQDVFDRHEACCLAFLREDGRVVQRYGLPAPVPFEVIDLREAPGRYEAHAERLQGPFDLSAGLLLRTALIHLPEEDRLLLVAHHLVMDFVSWRVLLEELAACYSAYLTGKTPALPRRTASFQRWAWSLMEHAASAEVAATLPHWRRVLDRPARSLPGESTGGNRAADAAQVDTALGPEDTRFLLTEAHRAYGTGPEDLLLAGLGLALEAWQGTGERVVWLEGHGRESLPSGIDVSRTVGWFTSLYPVALPAIDGAETCIKAVKQALRETPHRGLSFGLLGDALPFAHREISFNYLGRLDDGFETPWFRECGDLTRGHQSPELARLFALDAICLERGGQLRLSLTYDGTRFSDRQMEALAAAWKESLERLLRHCHERRLTPERVPADFTACPLSLAEYERFLADHGWNAGQVEDVYPLTPMQEGMLFQTLSEPEAPVYHGQIFFRLSGDLDREAFAEAWKALFRRHAVFRTAFGQDHAGRPLQVVLRDREPEIRHRDLRGLGAEEQDETIADYLREDRGCPLRPVSGRLTRLALFQVADAEHRVVWTSHHLLLDGWSLEIVYRELLDLYHHRLDLREAPRYAEYVSWISRRDREASRRFWSERLAGLETATALPADSVADGQDAVLAEVALDLGAAASDALHALCRRRKVTLSTAFHAAWAAVLARHTGNGDVVIGTVVSGRPASLPEVENRVGLFISTIPLRVEASGDRSFAELLEGVQQSLLDSEPHQHVSLAEIQAEHAPAGRLFEHLLVFENLPGGESDGDGLRLTREGSWEATPYGCNLIVLPEAEICLRLAYDPRRYRRGRMEQVAAHVQALLTAALENPDAPLRDLPILTEAERHALLWEINPDPVPYPANRTLTEAFAAQVERTPDAPAVFAAGQQLSYRELDRRADAIARFLVAAGLESEDRVGLSTGRTADAVAAMLGVLKAGGAYVPLDPAAPAERIRHIARDSGCRLVLTDGDALLPDGALPPHVPTCRLEEIAKPDSEVLLPPVAPGQLAYVIYTSGSTGEPKGVMIAHHTLLNLVAAYAPLYARFSASLRVGALASFAFDPSVRQMYCALLDGHCLHVIATETKRDPRLLAAYLEEHRVDVSDGTPGVFSLLLDEWRVGRARPVTHFLLGGEALPHEMAAAFFALPGAREVGLTNAYGPTECSVDSTYSVLEPETLAGRSRVPIGRPLQNTEVYLLGRGGELLPAGVAGEIYVAGVPVGRGYLGKPELTRQAFVPHPFRDGETAYRTGDLGRWREDGLLEYLGRADDQVKVRGHRVEPGEVASRILREPGVDRAVVVAVPSAAGPELAAYYIGAEAPSPAVLRSRLRAFLPGYMVPAFCVQLPELPLTVNGKVDRKRLPDPRAAQLDREAETVDAAPRDATEAALARLWEEVLDVGRVGIHDSFFELGGHSLKAVRLMARLRSDLGADLPLSVLFQEPTVERLARVLRRETALGAWSCLVPIQPAGSEPPLFCVHPVGGNVLCYQELASHLGADQPFYGLQSLGLQAGAPPHGTVEEMAAHYLREIRRVQPRGPYRLAGWSFGALVALEMARRLSEQGDEVSHLALFDPYAPSLSGDASGDAFADFEAETESLLLDVRRHNERAALRYTLRPFSGPVLLVHAAERETGLASRLASGWSSLLSDEAEPVTLPGDHFTLLRPPHVAHLAAQLQSFLKKNLLHTATAERVLS